MINLKSTKDTLIIMEDKKIGFSIFLVKKIKIFNLIGNFF